MWSALYLTRYGHMTPTLERFSHARTTNFAPLLFCLATLLTGCGGGTGGGGGGGGNQPPVATAACSFTPVATAFADRLDASDPDNDALTYTIVQQGALGRAETDVAGNYRYTPNPGARGQDSFVFRVTDSAGNQATGTINMIVGYTRIMPLGDSITAGVTVGGGCTDADSDPNCPPEGQRIGYRKKLYDDLTRSGYYVQLVGNLFNGSEAGLDPPNDRHEGHGAYSTAQINSEVSGWLTSAEPHVILLHAGTNDANNAANSGTASPNGGFVADATNSILARIYQYRPQAIVFVAKIAGSPNSAVDTHIASFNADVEARINDNWRDQLQAQQLFMVDMYTALGNRTTAAGGDFADNLHPNDTGYQKMANAWLTRLTAGNLLPRCP